ncbi:MAG TPA: phosphotransferase [Steroidobacteraceae bacterium]|nr:phosphotransferase [Steroidobacteraceae bacterium]
MPNADARLALLTDWLVRDLHLAVARIEPASSDASFRRYFRVYHPGGTLVVMDAPPPHEDVRPYLKVSALLEALGAHVPRVHEADATRGLLLLEDLGGTQYLARLEAGSDPEPLYRDALEVLADIQAQGGEAAAQLPPYDRVALRRELDLLPEWFLMRHLELELPAAERELLERTFELLIAEGLAQPQVFVHRDYHSRNLMVLTERNPGVLDFQDALRGPLGYDLVSLLKDCYIRWPRARVLGWVRAHHELLAVRGFEPGPQAELVRGFDLIGVQRHLKVLGIFARLNYRDGKPGYLRDLPLTLRYVLETCALYPGLAELGQFLERRAAPRLAAANARALEAAQVGRRAASPGRGEPRA